MSLIRLRNIHVGFGGPAILESISVSIDAGERLCLLGRNGTGKSTLLKVISGEVKAESGDFESKQNLTLAVLDQEPRGDLEGSIFDVAVDIREGSPTYGKWVSTILTSEDKEMLFIPKGFAHGFCTREKDTEVIYKCSEVYSAEYERGIIWNDPFLNITWPETEPFLSPKDKEWPVLGETDNDFNQQDLVFVD